MTNAVETIQKKLDEYEALGKECKAHFDGLAMHADEPVDEFLELIEAMKVLVGALEFYDDIGGCKCICCTEYDGKSGKEHEKGWFANRALAKAAALLSNA